MDFRNLTAGVAGLRPGTKARNLVQLDSSAKLPAVDGSQLTNLPSTADQTARDQIALTNLRLLLNSGVASGALVQGYQWELATDEWGATSTDETYTAGSPNYYTNGGYGSDVLTGSFTYTVSETVSAGSVANIYDNNTATYVQWGASVATAVKWMNVQLTSAGAYQRFNFWVEAPSATYDVTAKVQGSNDGSSYTDLASIATFTLTSGAGGQWRTIDFTSNSTSYLHYRLYMTLSNSSGVNIRLNEAELIAYSVTNMTLLPPSSVSVSSAPTYMDAYCLWKDDSGTAVLGTDFTVELSRDGGTTYTTATLTNLASYDGTYSIIKARASVSAQPSGTSMKARIKTLNTKAQRVAAPAIYAE
jgi:hypothetical protein